MTETALFEILKAYNQQHILDQYMTLTAEKNNYFLNASRV